MQAHLYVALVTLLTVLTYFWMAAQVARTRRRVGIFAPTMTGDPLLERTIRAHSNTLEWLPIFFPSLWLFAVYWNSTVAAILGLVWVIGRIVYFLGYVVDTSKRRAGFLIQALATAALVLGALGRLIYLAVTAL
jgi:glutathione S-transferase